jgi:acetyltransferase-like isoleucine patch superfamily enzyme
MIHVGNSGAPKKGDNCIIQEDVLFRAGGGHVTLGDDVSVNPFTRAHGQAI